MTRFLVLLFLMLPAANSFADTRNIGDDYRFTYVISDSSGNPVSGQTPQVSVQKSSNGYWLDFDDGEFKSSGWTSKASVLTEDAENGVYYYDFTPPSAETSPEEYVFVVDNSDATYGDHQAESVCYQNISSFDATSQQVTPADGSITSFKIAAGAITATQAPNLDAAVSSRASGSDYTSTRAQKIDSISDATDGDKEGSSYTGIENLIRQQR